MPDPVAFVCAMPMELTPLKRRLSLTKARIGTLDAYRGSLDGRAVVAMVTGMGTELATRGLEQLTASVKLERVVVVGITGAIHQDTPIGTLVRPAAVTNGATGVTFRPDPLGAGPASGTMWTTDTLITDADVLAGLRADGIVSLDMETAAIAEVCERHDIPWSVFRAISDRATDGSVDEEVFRLSNQDGTTNGKAVAAYVMKHPGRIASMARMGKEVRMATERAADAAVHAVSASFGAAP
jgi:adenosylhomocysteine nucleosidase